MVQSARERHKLIFDTWAGGKSLRETARIFGISDKRVSQIVKQYQQRLVDEEEMRTTNDPLLKALRDGKITTLLFNSLVREGYVKSFGIDELVYKLRTNTITKWDIRGIGTKSLTRLREEFRTQEEIDTLNGND